MYVCLLTIGYGNRFRMQQLQQADWVRQQVREKELYNEQARIDKQANDQQTLHLNQLLKEEQHKHDADRRAMLVAMQETNLQLAKEKKDSETKQKNDRLFQETHEVHFTLTNDFMTENPLTEKSQLANHRVKPYHYKGLNQEQTAAIMHERSQQLKEQELLRKTKAEEDRLWALQ